jgi:signal transduction histidine kinase
MTEWGARAKRRHVTLAACYLFFVVLLASLAWPAQALTLALRQAQATVTVNGQTTRQVVSLPYHWDRHHAGLAGEAVFELPFELDQMPTVPFGLYVPRVGNAYEVWLNGVLLQRNGDLQNYNGSDFAKAPRYVVVSPGILRVHSNILRIRIRADVGRGGGLASLVLASDEDASALYLVDYRWRTLGSMVVATVSLLVGLIALALLLSQTHCGATEQFRCDPLYLYASLAELCWAISVSDFFTERPVLPWPWWGMVPIVMTSVWTCGVILFSVEVFGWGQHSAAIWLRRWLGFLLVSCVAACVATFAYGYPAALTTAYAFSGLTLLLYVAVVVWFVARSRVVFHWLLALMLMLNMLIGCYDLYVMRLDTAYSDGTYLRYISVLFGLTLLYIVVTRFRTANIQVRDLLDNMATKVAHKEQALAQSYQRMEQFAREQERSSERTRILRDMHDGVGSHISTAIRQLESGQAMPAEVLQTLRDSLDQLKLSIDVMHLTPGDITALLANLRYRLEPRFKTSGIALQWDVDLVPPLVGLDDKAMRHLQFMVFEALSNVLQHAHATRLIIELHATPQGGAQLRVMDNGKGFDVEHVQRRGLRSLRERAAAIGANLRIDSQPGKTVVEIGLG